MNSGLILYFSINFISSSQLLKLLKCFDVACSYSPMPSMFSSALFFALKIGLASPYNVDQCLCMHIANIWNQRKRNLV